MVKGIEKFKEYFSDKQDNYILIGGSACDFLMDESGLEFRATKDLDIVLITESLDSDFSQLLWKFIENGSYKNRCKNPENRQYYRFDKPKDKDFPFMIELFSTTPDALGNSGKMKLKNLDEDDIYSLSAIIMDNLYYDMVKNNRKVIDDISVAGLESLIILKAKAFNNLTEMKKSGIKVKSKDIKKHKNDIIRLSVLLKEDDKFELGNPIKKDFAEFLDNLSSQEEIDLKQLGLRNLTIDELVERLKNVYSI